MPYLKLNTNVAINTQNSALISELSKIISEQTGKPERYVLVEAEGNRTMLFAGGNEPLAFLECKSIGLNPGQAKAISAALSKVLHEQMGIQPGRIYIEFSNSPGEFWGWNGSTFG